MVETTYHIPGAPRIALLADLHGRDPAPVLASLRSHAPSLVCLAGDFIYGSWPEDNVSPLVSQPNVLPFFRACAEIAPTYFSLGNHEQMLDQADLAAIADTGVVVLDNRWGETDVDGRKIIIGCLSSAYATDYRKAVKKIRSAKNRYPKKEAIEGLKGITTADRHTPDTDWLTAFSSVPGFHILLSHHPEYFPLVPPSVDLVLSGHAHGGQWRFFGHGVWCPGQGLWPRWTRGVYDGKLVVSAGLSNTTWVPRLFNPTEVVYIEGS